MPNRPVRRPELTELETFAVAAREGSLARAAAELHLTTAGAAKRVDSLEAIVGTPLFDRSPRGVTLTTAGRRFLPRVNAFLEESDAMLSTVSELRADNPALRIEGLQELTGKRPAPSTEAVLAHTETLFATMFHASGDGILIARRGESIIDLNDAACRILGHPRETLLGGTDRDLGLWRTPEERRAVAESTGPLHALPATILHPDGSEHHLEISRAELEVGGEAVEIYTLADVTERVAAERRTATVARQQAALAELGLVGLRSGWGPDLIAEVLETVLANTHGDVATLLQYDEEREVLRRVAHLEGEGARGLELDEAGDQHAVVVDEGSPLAIGDLRRHASFRGSALVEAGMRSALIGICERGGRPWGLVRVLAFEPDAFSEPDLSFVRSVTHLLAIVRGREPTADGASVNSA